MKIQFAINYRTQWGETLCVIGQSTTEQWTEKKPLELSCEGEDYWTQTVELSDFNSDLDYIYAIRYADGNFMYESGHRRHISLEGAKRFFVQDFWRAPQDNDVFSAKAFVKGLFSRGKQKPLREPKTANVTFQICLPRIERNQGLAIIGSCKELGNWAMDKKVVLDGSNYPNWHVSLNLKSVLPIEYKYVIYNLETGEAADLEWGENRRIWHLEKGEKLIRTDIDFRYTQPRWKGAGVAVPVFSLRSEQGFGVGEFADLKLLADWAAATGQKMIQTLPINDTTLLHTFKDSYPYDAVSVFALNPIFIRLTDIMPIPQDMQAEYDHDKAYFNGLTICDYQKVVDTKMKYLRAMYPIHSKEVFKSEDYKQWYEQNKQWLEGYAVFSYLRDQYGTPRFGQWPAHQQYDQKDVHSLLTGKAKKEILFFCWLQYLLHIQLHEAIHYVHQQGVAVKGDIPIGISPNSVDAWMYPQLFNLDASAGAPPDDFSISGQNWGFPTYNWDVMAQDNFDWWQRRFKVMSEYFDAYRIDHILGFFRIWQMPRTAVWGLTGQFCPAMPYSLDDLRAQGIWLDEDRMLKPYIRPWFLQEMFGERWMQIKDTFFQDCGWEMLEFKPEFDTQVKVKEYFQGREDEEAIHDRNCLYELHCEVLFVRDHKNPNLLHPRISMMQSRTFRELYDQDKQNLERLYNDFFYHRHNDFWWASAMRKLPTLVKATDMLVCGEDLGMVPDCVPDVIHRLQILSLEIQRMPKDPKREFGHPNDAPYLSVCTTGTHDTNPIRAWWEEDQGKTQRYYNNVMGRWGEAPRECSTEIAEAILKQHIYSPAMWVILPLQDWLATSPFLRLADCHAERINVPDNPDNFWCYRMHLTLEKLLADGGFNAYLKDLIGPRK